MNRTGEADRLLRLIVRERRTCERCGGPGSQVAHILRRGYHATRCDERNVWFLCGGPGSNGCHALVDSHEVHQIDLIHKTIGWPAYEALRARAHAGPAESLSVFWPAETARLRARCRALDIPLRGAAA